MCREKRDIKRAEHDKKAKERAEEEKQLNLKTYTPYLWTRVQKTKKPNLKNCQKKRQKKTEKGQKNKTKK